MSTIKILMIAVFGHLLCGICDCLLIYAPSGKFEFQLMKDNDKMRETAGSAAGAYKEMN